jgi:excisionase family DNA binding protein
MEDKEYYTIPELAKILGISRIAVYKKVKKGEIKAKKVGRIYAIPKKYVASVLGKELSKKEKKEIEEAVKKTVKEYGEVLKLLGQE